MKHSYFRTVIIKQNFVIFILTLLCCHIILGKGKSVNDGKTMSDGRPLSNQSIYLDLVNYKDTMRLEKNLLMLGAVSMKA